MCNSAPLVQKIFGLMEIEPPHSVFKKFSCNRKIFICGWSVAWL